MTEIEKLNMVKVLINDKSVNDDTILVYLNLAEGKILERCYPMGNGDKPMPKRYERLQVELASRYIVRRGIEGQIGSTTNGVTRSFTSANDEDLLKEVVQQIVLR